MHSSTSPSVEQRRVVQSIAAQFARLTDQRKPRGVRYALAPLLVMLVLAKLCGADTPQAIAQWVAYRAEWLKPALGLRWKRMPHPATWRRLLAHAIDVPQLEHIAGESLSALSPKDASVLNLDGKTLRGTIATGETHGLHLLALQQAPENMVVGQTAVGPHENEISAAKRLLKEACLQGRIVTGDAIFAQRELSRQVIEAGGDYLWKVKPNQEKLYQQLADFFNAPVIPPHAVDVAQTLDKGHGRIEERVLWASSRFADQLEWPHLSQVFAVRREVTDCRTRLTSCEMVYGITSLPPMEKDATALLELTRGHWSVENGLHYRRDVTFKEDACRMKSHRAAEALAVCNNLALGLIRHAGWNNVAEARRFYAAHVEQALLLISRPPS
jgi:predicted transposase YbfD/YdcC